MITKEQAVTLVYRDILHSDTFKDSKGRCANVRVNGQIKLWKTRPDDFLLPIKYGLNSYPWPITQSNTSYHLPSECPNG